jgi:hypothetical protein
MALKEVTQRAIKWHWKAVMTNKEMRGIVHKLNEHTSEMAIEQMSIDQIMSGRKKTKYSVQNL